jgi:penicillin V acylase-like amidase (Ntn superfamily)
MVELASDCEEIYQAILQIEYQLNDLEVPEGERQDLRELLNQCQSNWYRTTTQLQKLELQFEDKQRQKKHVEQFKTVHKIIQ